jgi:CheY-like chemotaxis protein/HPt (histidine-containing phosphotransfer) domain-containing protein
MLSSAGLKGDAQRSREAGFAAYLSKPFTRFELEQLLGRVVNTSVAAPVALITRHGIQDVQPALDVLLVEDNLVNQKLAIALLERWGHHVTVADDGQIALNLLAQSRFDLVLMDMMMPVLDGLEATRQFRASEQGARTPIVAMTANVMPGDRDRCLDAGMDDYLSKPIAMAELQRMLARFARAQNALRTDPLADYLQTVKSSEATSRAVFDYVTALLAVDQDVVDIIDDVFVEQWPQDVKKMMQAIEQGDAVPLLHTAHALKSALGMFGARPAVALAAELEVLASETSTFKAASAQATAGKILTALCEQVDYLLVALQSRRTGVIQ